MKEHPRHRGYWATQGGRIFSRRRWRWPRQLVWRIPRMMPPYVRLRAEGRYIECTVPEFVLEAFRGRPTDRRMLPKHLDGNLCNNRLENLEWVDERACDDVFTLYALRGTRCGLLGSRNANAKLNESEVRVIRKLTAEGVRLVDIAGTFGVSPTTVAQIRDGSKWGWLQ